MLLNWISFIDYMFFKRKFISLKNSEVIGYTYVTAIHWRHEVLVASAKEKIGTFEGILEVDMGSLKNLQWRYPEWE